jgi:ribulose-phosphate 3-epimerase
MLELAPSILAADFSRLGEQVLAAFAAGVKRIHIDVMDGQFVPNIALGPLVVEALRPLADHAGATLEVHLMIVQPERFLADFKRAGADVLIVPIETCPHLHRTVQQIHELGARPAVALNPATPLGMLEEILIDVDQVLVMTVDPGFGGQELIPSTLDKVARLQRMLEERRLDHITIEVDGGVHLKTIRAVAQAGVGLAVVGSGIFRPHDSIHENIAALRLAAAGV